MIKTVLVASGIVAGVVITPALAQVDVTEVAVEGIGILEMVLSAAVAILVPFAIRWTGSMVGFKNAQLEALLAAQVNDILHRGIGAAKAAALNEIQDNGVAIRFNNRFVEIALQFAISTMRGNGKINLREFFGLTDADLRRMIVARLPDYVGEPEAVDSATATVMRADAEQRAVTAAIRAE